MAASPRWKVVTHDGTYIASCKAVEDAAAIVALRGPGARIYDSHVAKSALVYTNGIDGNAGDSYDAVAQRVFERVGARKVA